MQNKSFEQYLIEHKLLTPDKLRQILDESKKTGETLRERVVHQNLIAAHELINYYQHELSIPYIDLSKFVLDPKLLDVLPKEFLRTHHVVPLSKSMDTLRVVMEDPLDIMLIDEVKLKSGLRIEVAVAFGPEIIQALDRTFGPESSIEELVSSTDLSQFYGGEEIEVAKLQSLAEEAPIVKLIDLLIMQALHERASDIHIEPEESSLKVRFRIDGVLHENADLPKHLQAAVISRTKIMSEMNIAEKRVPQDGRFKVYMEGGPVDVRVSTFPTIYGENIVMRLLEAKSILLSLEQSGLRDQVLEKFQNLIQKPHGIILVTGPTGSGKTTTLYSVLNTLNSPEKNIITVEDPVEYRLAGIRQSQVNVKAGLTFAAGLRSILRQDPDIILVGEIRDYETMEIAIHAALTGHLVFSTLHTNDAPGAITRMIDMGVQPYLIVSTVIGVLAQRLVRTICPKCKVPYKVEAKALKDLTASTKEKEYTVYKGKGCEHCHDTGYKGRIGLYELMILSEDIRQGIVNKASASQLGKTARAEGMQTLCEDGFEKILQGITTIEEVLRVTSEV